MGNETQNTTSTPSFHCQNNYSSVYETGQLRRAKMHVAHLISHFGSKENLPPALLQLLETSIILKTTDSKVLAHQLKRKQATIHADLQKIRHFLTEEPG
ncbi:hypothetical protein SAMN05216379_11268 [Nitrosomonas eutropha]|uniref:hypothetical protein n=1 Tax=Nitrosomonas eutropha TaxID=916 RepID=UPI00087F9C79|nr:hypothetical protein [Nitrosomonas eutropha]SCX18546.1 hypothetical protein SAMN05216379_11268 [Nitrosomonas eutropha]